MATVIVECTSSEEILRYRGACIDARLSSYVIDMHSKSVVIIKQTNIMPVKNNASGGIEQISILICYRA